MSVGPGLEALQVDAYAAVCRAFYAQESLKWEQEDVLTKLRDFWSISNQTHMSITQEARSDPDVVTVRGGGMPSRLGRTKTGMGMAAPAPSIGAGTAHAHQQQQQQQQQRGYDASKAMPPPPKRQRAAAAPSLEPSGDQRSWGSSPADSDFSIDSELTRRQRSAKKKGGGGGGGSRKGGGGGRDRKRAAKSGQAGGGGGGAVGKPQDWAGGISLQQQASMRRGPSRPSGGGGMPRVPSNGLARSRSTRQGGGGVDPLGYVGRRLWRLWPSESPPWVEGFIQFWDTDTDTYTIVYDPNTRDSTEEPNFDFTKATEGVDFVLGEYVDMTAVSGSKRQYETPWVPPEALAAPPPPGLLAAISPPPSKKRKSVSGAPVPADAPFEVTYLNARLPVAGEDELQQMLAVLERKERILLAEINILEYQEANREDIEERAKLERRFAELCDREAALMAEMAALQREAAAAEGA